MTSNNAGPFSFLYGIRHKAGTDTEGNELAVRRFKSPVLSTSVTEVFADEKQHQPERGEAQASSRHPFNNVAG
jgi:hypothetical protein